MDFLMTNFSEILFYIFAALAILGSVGVITLKNPVHAALSLLGTFFIVAVLFVLQHAEFLAAVQVMVYAGGIMVLFLFVIMLVSVRGLKTEAAFLSPLVPVAIIGAILVGSLIASAILLGVFAAGSGSPEALQMVDGARLGNTEAVGMVLYTKYLIPFEVVSVVLLVAMIGAIVFGRKDRFIDEPEGEVGS
jgi:NADH-quinone oxidoreductase subunit J